DLTPGLPGLLDAVRAPLDLALCPAVVRLGAGLAQDDVLDPVGAGPAGGGAALESDAPRRGAGAGDLLGERVEVVPGLRDLVAALLEGLGVVPAEPLGGGLDEDADLLAVDLGELGPVVGVPLAHLALVEHGREVDQLALAPELRHLARAGQAGRVGRVAAGDAGGEHGVEV